MMCAKSGVPSTTSSNTNAAKSAKGAGAAQAPTVVKVPVVDYSKEAFVVELLQQNERFEADGKGQRELILRVRVQSESAVRQFGLLVYPFASTFESLGIVNGPKADSVIFASGAPELRNAVADLAAGNYPQTFPGATPARVIRKATMSCSVYTKGCVVVLLPIGDAAVPEH